MIYILARTHVDATRVATGAGVKLRRMSREAFWVNSAHVIHGVRLTLGDVILSEVMEPREQWEHDLWSGMMVLMGIANLGGVHVHWMWEDGPVRDCSTRECPTWFDRPMHMTGAPKGGDALFEWLMSS